MNNERYAYTFLIYIGINPKYNGFKYLIDMIVYCIENDCKRFLFTGEDGLYGLIAEKYNLNRWSNVERGIRTAISNPNNTNLFKDITGASEISNKTFIRFACTFIDNYRTLLYNYYVEKFNTR